MGTATWPTFIVEAALGGPGSNNWMTFNDTSRGIFDTNTFPSFGGGATGYTDITADVREIHTIRGRQRVLDDFAAGQLSLRLDDNAGTYGGGLGTTAVPNVPVRIRAQELGSSTVDYLFTGYVDAWQPAYSPGSTSDVEMGVTATDGFKPLQSYKPTPTGYARSQETTDARVVGILNQAGWASGDRQIDVSATQIAAATLTNSALGDIQDAVKSEQGRVYMSADNRVVFENRTHRLTNSRSNVVQDIWESHLTLGTLTFESCVLAYDDTLVQNTIYAQRSGGSLCTATDATSITTNFEHDLSDTSLVLTNDTDVQSWADWQLFQHKNAELRIDSITVRPLVQGTTAYVNKVLGYQISDCITAVVYPPRGTAIGQVSYIEGIEHSITTEPQDWTVTFRLSAVPASQQIMLIFDSATLGKFDTNTFARW